MDTVPLPVVGSLYTVGNNVELKKQDGSKGCGPGGSDGFTREGKVLLVLTRKVGEGIAIGEDVKIVVMQIKGKQVRLGIKASPKTVVHREEIFQKIQEENQNAVDASPANLDEAAASLRRANADFAPGSTPLKRLKR